MKKDYYKILGVAENCTQQDIKRAYRELAKQFHPDTNPGDAHAEKQFKEVSEAYEALKDPEKRKKYDQFRRFGYSSGEDWFSFDPHAFRRQRTDSDTFSGPDFSSTTSNFSFTDILREIFRFDEHTRSHSAPRRRKTSPQKLTAKLFISLEESALGAAKLIKISSYVPCSSCSGSGYSLGMSCTACQGAGRIKQSRKVRVKIPRAIENGHVLKLPGLGFRENGHASDLYVTVFVRAHKFFKRDGLHIHCDVPLADGILQRGTKIRIQTIYGNKVELQIPAGTAKGTVFRVPGMGISSEHGKGDQLVKIV